LKILNLAAEYLRENDVHVDEREDDYYHVHSGLYDHYNGKPNSLDVITYERWNVNFWRREVRSVRPGFFS